MACKIDKYLDIKTCSCQKRLIGEIVLACEDEIVDTTETSLVDKKVTSGKVMQNINLPEKIGTFQKYEYELQNELLVVSKLKNANFATIKILFFKRCRY